MEPTPYNDVTNVDDLFETPETPEEMTEEFDDLDLVTVTIPGRLPVNVVYDPGMTVRDALNRVDGLYLSPNAQNLWVDGAEAAMDTPLAVGASILVAGKVAGG